MIASLQLLTKSPTISGVDHSVWLFSVKCAGRAASRQAAHQRGGTSSSAHVRSALGGHITDGVMPGKRSNRPNRAPMK